MNTSFVVSQQDFLRQSMKDLGMSRAEFAERIGAEERRLENWLLPTGSKGFREMDELVWKFIREILKSRQK